MKSNPFGQSTSTAIKQEPVGRIQPRGLSKTKIIVEENT